MGSDPEEGSSLLAAREPDADATPAHDRQAHTPRGRGRVLAVAMTAALGVAAVAGAALVRQRRATTGGAAGAAAGESGATGGAAAAARAAVSDLRASSHKHDSSDLPSESADSTNSSVNTMLGAGFSPEMGSHNASKPHIIIALIDDQGFADMGYANEFDALKDCTPFMDKLAHDGIKLQWYYTQQLCTPARAALLTGLYPIHLGMQHDVIQPESVFGLPIGHKMLPSYLKDHFGYKTHCVGKWHLGHYKKEYLPQHRGFDNFYGYLSDQLWYYNHKSPHACTNGACFYDMNHNGRNAADSIGVYSTFLFTDVMTQILEESSPSEPMFAYLSWQNVHAPLDPPPDSFFNEKEIEVLQMVNDPHRRAYASMTLILDNAMKKIMGDMSRLGYYDNSILVVASDNGGCPYSGGSNWPLRGAKQYLWEGGIRVQSFVHSPLIDHAARGQWYPHVFHVSDWLPTLVQGALHAAPDLLPAELDGVDHWRHMIHAVDDWKTDPPRTELLHNIDLWSLEGAFTNVSLLSTAVQAIRVGDMKLLMGQDASNWFKPHMSDCATHGYCTPGYESTDDCSYEYGDSKYLFNMSADPFELNNLVADEAYAGLLTTMEARLTHYRSGMVDPAYKSAHYHRAYLSWAANDYFIGPFDDLATDEATFSSEAGSDQQNDDGTTRRLNSHTHWDGALKVPKGPVFAKL
jgi:arylsulfatase A-like enzyme